MKDKILEIMQGVDKANADKHYETPDKRQQISARLIADMVKAFTEWIRTSDTLNPQLADWIYGTMTTDELFTYWYANIKDK